MNRVLVVTIAGLLGSTVTWAQALTEAEIAEAIKVGLAKKSLSLVIGADDFTLVIDGPMSRIAAAARKAAEQYQPFTPVDVDDDMRASVLRVVAFPKKPVFAGSKWYITGPATHMVILPKSGKADAVQPASAEVFPEAWTNAMGGRFEGQGIRATFDLSALPPGEFEVVVVCPRCRKDMKGTVKQKDRDRLK